MALFNKGVILGYSVVMLDSSIFFCSHLNVILKLFKLNPAKNPKNILNIYTFLLIEAGYYLYINNEDDLWSSGIKGVLYFPSNLQTVRMPLSISSNCLVSE